jgi:hypothetical protein
MGRVKHEVNDHYVLEVFKNGSWQFVQKITKQGGANSARSSAKSTGERYRVWNVTKQAVYAEVGPTR